MLKALVYLLAAYLLRPKTKTNRMLLHYDKGPIMCVCHPGNGLLRWSNGDMQCYVCGKEKYGR